MGFLFLILYPESLPRLLPPPVFANHHLSHTTLSHTIFHIQLCHTPSFTYNFVTHDLSHTTLSHTIFHTQLCNTPSFLHNFVTHHLSHTTLSHIIFHTQFVTHHISHTTLSHTIFHTQLCHTPSFTYNFVTHHLSHPPLSHTIFKPSLHTIFHISHLPSFCVAGVAQTHICGTLRGRRGTISHPRSFCVADVALMALGGALGSVLVAGDAAAGALCVAGVAFGDIHLRFTWQAWHLVTSTVVLHGRPGTWRHPPLLCHAPSLSHTILSHTILSHTNFVTHHLSHTIFHTPHWHTPSFTHRHRPYFTHLLSHITLLQTIFHTPSFTHHIGTHHLSHTVTDHISHTFFHTSHCYKPSFTYHLSHTTLSHTIFRHTIFHTPLCHTPSFQHNFVTRSLSHTTFTHTIFHTQLCHTRTIFLCHTPSFTYNFVTHNFVLLLDPPPPPLSFLPSPAPLRHYVIMYVLTIGRSCLVGLSGPLILCVAEIVEGRRKTTSKRFTNDVRNDVGTRPYSHSWPTQTPRQEKLDNPMPELLQSMIDQIRPQGEHPAEFPMAPLNPNNHIYIYISPKQALIAKHIDTATKLKKRAPNTSEVTNV